MTYFTHVFDIAVEDLSAASETVTLLTGVEGIPMWEGYQADSPIDAMHFPVGGLATLGLMSVMGDVAPEERHALLADLIANGDSGYLLGFAVKNLEATMSHLTERGVPFTGPWRVGDELLVRTEPVCGVRSVFAEHDDGHWENWYRGKLRNKSVVPPAVKTRHKVLGTLGIEYASDDLGSAVKGFTALLGEEPSRAHSDSGIDAYDFPLIGAQNLRVYGPGEQNDSALARRIQHVVDDFGSQMMSFRFVVESVRDSHQELVDHGIAFETDEPVMRDGQLTWATTRINGAAYEYVEVQ